MEKDENDIKQNEQENVDSQTQENTATNKRMDQTGLKGAATAAGAYFGGSTGAKIGSKAADVINNSKVGNGITDAAAKAGNVANKLSPTGKTNQKLTNAAANSGALDLVDKGIDASADNHSSSPKGKTPDKAAKNPNFNKSNNPVKKGENSPTIGGKNPSRNKYNDTLKKHSKHADGSNDDLSVKQSGDSKKSINPLKKDGLFPKKKLNNNEPESEETSIKDDIKALGNMLKLTAGIISGFFGVLGAIGTFIITHLVLISIILIIAAVVVFIAFVVNVVVSFFQYGKEDDGTVCYVTPSCNKVVIKSETGDKTYSMDEYIAGAIVNYYEHDDYAVMDTDVDQNLLKAFSVVIHSDIAAFSDYDFSSETCTVTDTSRFSNIYVPTIQNDTTNNDDTSSDNTDNSSSGEVDGVSGVDAGQNTQVSEEQPEEDEETKRKNDYYNKAKTAADSVISEVVDIYTQRIDIFYDGYKSTLGTSSATGSDYKKIIRDYIEGSPDYEEVTSNNDSDITEDVSTSEDDNTKDDNDGEVVGIYPVCDYQQSNSDSKANIVYANDICSTVHINSGSNAGDHTIEEFIAGAVYGEVGSWSNYPELMKAQAVAARTYLVGRAKVENGVCYIDTGGSTLGYKPNAPQVIVDAVNATAGEYLMKNGKRLTAAESQFDALCISDGYKTNTSSTNYTLCQKGQQIPKSWLNPKLTNTLEYYYGHKHGIGMSQYGAYYLAREENKTYKEILKYYYDADVSIISSKEYIMPINTFSYISGEIHDRCDGKHTYRDHNGMDFAAPKGTPVYAAHSGTVASLYNTNYQCYPNCKKGEKEGLGVAINNGDGTISYYFHFSKRENLVEGQQVQAGQKIGEVGNTGQTYGASGGYHLHYQMLSYPGYSLLNPRDYLPLDEKGYGLCYDPR